MIGRAVTKRMFVLLCVLFLLSSLRCKQLAKVASSVNVSGAGTVGKVLQGVSGGLNAYMGAKKVWEDLTVEDEIAIGRGVSARILKKKTLKRDKPLSRYVSFVGKTVARHSGYDLGRFVFGVIESEQVNAFSTPGGYVFVTTGAISFCRDESELAGVLAHEIAHIQSQHIIQEIESRRNKTGALQAIKGAANVGAAISDMGDGSDQAQGLIEFTTEVGEDVLLDEGYPPEQEHEADRGAVFLTGSTGYDPSGLLRVLKRQQKEGTGGSGEGKNSTHPVSEKRIKNIKSEIQKQRKEDHIKGEGVKLSSRFRSRIGS